MSMLVVTSVSTTGLMRVPFGPSIVPSPVSTLAPLVAASLTSFETRCAPNGQRNSDGPDAEDQRRVPRGDRPHHTEWGSLGHRVGTRDRGGQQLSHRAGDRRRRLAQHLDAERHVELGEYSGRSGLPSQGRERFLPALRHYVGGSQENLAPLESPYLGPGRERGLGSIGRSGDVLRRAGGDAS